MILVGGGFIVVVLGGDVNLRRGTHGGPGKISCQHRRGKDQDEPERTHVLQGKRTEFEAIGSQKEREKIEDNPSSKQRIVCIICALSMLS